MNVSAQSKSTLDRMWGSYNIYKGHICTFLRAEICELLRFSRHISKIFLCDKNEFYAHLFEMIPQDHFLFARRHSRPSLEVSVPTGPDNNSYL